MQEKCLQDGHGEVISGSQKQAIGSNKLLTTKYFKNFNPCPACFQNSYEVTVMEIRQVVPK